MTTPTTPPVTDPTDPTDDTTDVAELNVPVVEVNNTDVADATATTFTDAAGVDRIAGPDPVAFTPAPVEPSEQEVADYEAYLARVEAANAPAVAETTTETNPSAPLQGSGTSPAPTTAPTSNSSATPAS